MFAILREISIISQILFESGTLQNVQQEEVLQVIQNKNNNEKSGEQCLFFLSQLNNERSHGQKERWNERSRLKAEREES